MLKNCLLTHFPLLLIKQVINLRNVKSKDLKFRIDLQDPVEPFHRQLFFSRLHQQNVFS